VRAEGLTKRYGQQDAVRDASFEVRRGEVFGFLGPNGSGKSTTIGMLLGLVEPTAGTFELFGMGPDRHGEALARVGAIIESPAFYPYLSGRDNLRALGHLRPGVDNARIEEVLAIVGLTEAAGKKYKNYSLGMKQRLGIGWTLLHDPDFLVLDEPTNGLDPAGMMEVRHLIQRLAAGGKTIFISSHLLNEIEQVCDRVAIILRGEIIAEGYVDELVSQKQHIKIQVDRQDEAATILCGMDGVDSVEREDRDLIVVAPDVRPSTLNVALVQAGIAVDGIRKSSNTLEQAFLELTKDAEIPA
jgi:ABC-2 type transport system ATP-binding protein